MKKFYTTFILIFVFSNFTIANNKTPGAPIVTAQAGNWNDPSTWIGGEVPNAINCNKIEVNHAVIVTANDTAYVDFLISTSGSLTINSGVRFGINCQTTIASARLTLAGILENYGELYLNVATVAEPGFILIQTDSTAKMIFDGGDGTASGSIPDGVPLIGYGSSWAQNAAKVKAGTLQFLRPPFGANSLTMKGKMFNETFDPYNDPTFNLTLIFGGSISAGGSNKFIIDFGIGCNNLIIDNSTTNGGNGTPYFVESDNYPNYSNGWIVTSGNVKIENGGLTMFNSLTWGKNLQNNGVINCKYINWQLGQTFGIPFSAPYTMSGTGVFNNVSQFNIYNSNPYGLYFNVDNFIVNNQFNISSSDNSNPSFLYLGNHSLTIHNYPTATYTSSGNQSRVITNGTGTLKFAIDAGNQSEISRKIIPLGTKDYYAPLMVYQKEFVSNQADIFNFSVKDIASYNDSSQMIKAIWQIEEEIPGGNDSLKVDFGFGLQQGDNFAPAFAKLYNSNNGTTWNSSTYNYQFSADIINANGNLPIISGFIGKNNSNFNERHYFAAASGKGIDPAGDVIKFSSGNTNNWSQATTWQNNTVPSATDKVYIKPNHTINVDENAVCDALQHSGAALNILNNNSLTIGPVNGSNKFLYSTSEFNIGNGTLNINGEFTHIDAPITMADGTINIDPNSGNSISSLQESNINPLNALLYIKKESLYSPILINMYGNINIKDPFDNTKPFLFLLDNNASTQPLNITFGDGDGTHCTPNSLFNVIMENRNVEFNSPMKRNLNLNMQNEQYDTMYAYSLGPMRKYNNLKVISGNFVHPAAPSPLDYEFVFLDSIISNGYVKLNQDFLGWYSAYNPNKAIVGTGKVDFFSANFINGNVNVLLDTVKTNHINLANSKLILNNSNILNEGEVNGNIIFVNYPDYYTGFVTNGTGKFFQKIRPDEERTYQLAPDEYTIMHPIVIKGAATGHTTDFIGIRINDSVYKLGTTGEAFNSKVVNKTWHINELVNGGSNVAISPNWFAVDELPYFTRNACYVSHYTNGWDLVTAGIATSTEPYSITRINITTFSPFAVTSSLVALPIQFISFTGSINQDKKASLQFTVQENNIKEYYIQKSLTGSNYTTIKTIQSIGNGKHQYSVTDDEAVQQFAYYKIKEIDISGNIKYSNIIRLSTTNQSAIELQNNIVQNSLQFNTPTILIGQQYIITNSVGQVIATSIISSKAIKINTNSYSAGVYYLTIENNKTYKFIKQ